MSNGLEREMNEWILKENIKKIQIISQSSNGSCNDMAIVVVLYEE